MRYNSKADINSVFIIVHCCPPPSELSQQEQRHLSRVIYNGGINWTDRDGTDLGVTVYSAIDDLQQFKHIKGDGEFSN